MFRTRNAVYFQIPNDQGTPPPEKKPPDTTGLLALGKTGEAGKAPVGDTTIETPPPGLKFAWSKDTPYDSTLTLGERPEGLPDDLWDDKTKSMRVGSVLKSRDDLRKQVSTLGAKAPKDAAEYKFEAIEELKTAEKALVTGPDDPLVKWFRETAFEKKLPQAVVTDLYNGFLKQAAGLMPATTTPEKEMALLGPRAQQIVNVARTRGETMMTNGVFDENDFAEYCVACGTAGGLRMMQKLLESYGETPMPTLLDNRVTDSADMDKLDVELKEIRERARKGDPKAQRDYDAHMAKRERLYAGKAA